MKASELRIGNYVTNGYCDSFKTIFEVQSINEEGINLSIEDYERASDICIEPEYTFDLLLGVPLTEEWLLNFGFEKRPDLDVCDSDGGSNCTEFYKKDGVSISFYRGNFWDATINHELDFNLEYVHLLQNFWMCYKQEELTIKNK